MRAVANLTIGALVFVLCVACVAAPSFRLITNGPTAEYISGGVPQLFVSPAPDVRTEIYDKTSPVGTDFFRLFVSYGGGTFFRFDVGTDGLSKNLAPGFYPSAERASFAMSGKAGLDVEMLGRGCNEVGGSFVIHSVTINSAQDVVAIDVSFTQLCEGREPALMGRFTYNAAGLPIPALAAYEVEQPKVIPTLGWIGRTGLTFAILLFGLAARRAGVRMRNA